MHAARVPVWAARPNLRLTLFREFSAGRNGGNEVFGGPPKTARRRRALPGTRQRVRLRLQISGSKDKDFYQRALLYGAPPKFIWLRLGNCTRDDLLALIRGHERDISAFETSPESVLILS